MARDSDRVRVVIMDGSLFNRLVPNNPRYVDGAFRDS
jgi:hypothetical protein